MRFSVRRSWRLWIWGKVGERTYITHSVLPSQRATSWVVSNDVKIYFVTDLYHVSMLPLKTMREGALPGFFFLLLFLLKAFHIMHVDPVLLPPPTSPRFSPTSLPTQCHIVSLCHPQNIKNHTHQNRQAFSILGMRYNEGHSPLSSSLSKW